MEKTVYTIFKGEWRMIYRAAIFDFDGTLLDTLDDLADSMNEVLAAFGMPPHPVDAYRFFVGDGMINLARRAATPSGIDDATAAAMAKLMDEKYGANWARKTRPYDGIEDLLAALGYKGLKLGLLSNKPDNFTQIMARHYFGDKTFAAVFGAREGVAKKPDPAAALEIASLFDIAPEAILYFGDTNTDMKTGRAAGMRTIGVSWGFRPVRELEESGAQAIIDHPSQALSLLS